VLHKNCILNILSDKFFDSHNGYKYPRLFLQLLPIKATILRVKNELFNILTSKYNRGLN